jgi:hypothetical protein
VLTVERNAKFHSSQTEAGLCTVENVILSEDHQEDIKLSGTFLSCFHSFFFFTANDNS